MVQISDSAFLGDTFSCNVMDIKRERSGERPFTGTYLDAKSVKQGISKPELARALRLLKSPLTSSKVTYAKESK